MTLQKWPLFDHFWPFWGRFLTPFWTPFLTPFGHLLGAFTSYFWQVGIPKRGQKRGQKPTHFGPLHWQGVDFWPPWGVCHPWTHFWTPFWDLPERFRPEFEKSGLEGGHFWTQKWPFWTHFWPPFWAPFPLKVTLLGPILGPRGSQNGHFGVHFWPQILRELP